METKKFDHLIQKYLNGIATVDEESLINQWFGEMEDKNISLSDNEKQIIKRRMAAHLKTRISPFEVSNKTKSNYLDIPLWKVAASISILIVIGMAMYFAIPKYRENFSIVKNENIEDKFVEKNNGAAIRKVILTDNSIVFLQPGSEISYFKSYNKENREVFLVGEAFFEVTKNTKKPFFVYGGNTITKVLGTSFSVKVPSGAQQVEVKVRTGRVSVYEKQESSNAPNSNLVILTPNQKATYILKERRWETGLVEEPFPLTDKASFNYVFDNEEVNVLFKKLQAAYGIEIEIENDNLKSCTFTGDISTLTLFQKLDIVCKSIGATYKVKGTKILVV